VFSLQSKNAFITGGARGIGLAVAERYIAAGAQVVISDIADATDVADEIGAIYLPIDVTSEESVATALQSAEEKIGKLDIVVNNAGGALADATVENETNENYQKTLRINTDGVFFGLKYGPRHMNDDGAVINTASLAAVYTIGEYASYNAAKAAVLALTRSAAVSLGPRGIRVNAILPGTHTSPSQPADGLEAHLCRKLAPLGKEGKLADLAGVYHFLAAPESSYITGQPFIVDGGWGLGLTPAAAEALTQDFAGERHFGYTGDFA